MDTGIQTWIKKKVRNKAKRSMGVLAGLREAGGEKRH